MDWQRLTWGVEGFVDGAGKICGEVRKGWSRWTAYFEGQSLGEFVSEQSAKNAVQNAAMTERSFKPARQVKFRNNDFGEWG
jgi:hypothetical protein